ncbi:MAG: hypothetical protein F6J93_27845 [Oscillatoria sp. SIO1A7]|nr:hypothetical protein [Oscillatoria sp. SIO1A7]
MPSNNAAWYVRALAEKFPEAISLMISPEGWDWKGQPPLPYALDNGAWPAFKNERPWSESQFLELVDRAARCPLPPKFLIVPDAVADCGRTLEGWHRWYPELKSLGWPLAFAVQDGIKTEQVPEEADLIFVGGTTEWKLRTLRHWCDRYPCHIGQINTGKRLWQCHEACAQSVDGTGWFRDPRTFFDLVRYLEIVYGHRIEHKQLTLFQSGIACDNFL